MVEEEDQMKINHVQLLYSSSSRLGINDISKLRITGLLTGIERKRVGFIHKEPLYDYVNPYRLPLGMSSTTCTIPMDILSLIHVSGLGYAHFLLHWSDVIIGAMESQITSLTIVYSTVYLPAQRASNAENISIWWCLCEIHELWAIFRIAHIVSRRKNLDASGNFKTTRIL